MTATKSGRVYGARLGVRLSAWAAMILVASVGCKHGEPASATAAADTEADPDPTADAQADLPAFCNPTGRQGPDLQQCLAKNAAIYRTFDDDAKKREPWYNFPVDSWVDSREVDQAQVLPVAAREGEAVKRLEQAPLVELTASEAQAFTGKADSPKGLKPYLVRGLYLFRDTGGFTVFTKEQAILIRHDSVGSASPKEHRTAVVVYLGFKPKSVFVDCHVAE